MAQENESIENALALLQDIQLAVEEECKSLLDFVSEFAKRYDEEKCKLPYHLNVIDELHINENAHSRILMKLLCYQNDRGEYDILQSLLDYIKSLKGAEAFKDIKIETPTITQEKQRIDLWIRDKGYAIIFENKIYNAIDQEEQICRYIEKTIVEGYKVENIYVIYLSQDGKEPEEQTWGDYKEELKDRYLTLSFYYDILRWLQDYVLPNIRHKDDDLKCAIKQYIDYLKGLFNLRTIQIPMIMTLRKTIQQKLELEKKNPQECVSSLEEMIKSCNELIEILNSLREDYRHEFWKQQILNFYPDLLHQIEKNKNEDDQIKIVFNYSNKKIDVRINRDHGKLFCQVRNNDGSDLDCELKRKLLDCKNVSDDWYEGQTNDWYSQITTYFVNDNDGVKILQEVVGELKKLTEE